MPGYPKGLISSLAPRLAEAIALHQQGRLQEAQARYARILLSEPGNVQARYHQGLLRLQTGEIATGITALKQVVKRQPDHADAHYNLGLAYSQQGDPQQALRCFERVLALRPDNIEARFYLGMTLASLGRNEEALPLLERVLVHRPELAEAHHNLAGVLAELGRHAEALAGFEKAIVLRPDFAEAYNGLGAALAKLNHHEEAGQQFRQAIRLQPGLVEAYTGLSDVLRTLGQYQAAADCCEQAIRVRPSDAVAHVVLGQSLVRLRNHQAALAAFEHALVLQPSCAAAHDQLGAEFHLWGRQDEARAHGDRAIALEPNNEAFMSGQLFNLHYDSEISAAELASRHRAFGERFEVPLKSFWQPHTNTPDPERVLRVGFVSGDFRQHPVGYFMADLLVNLKATGLELFAYANHGVDDVLTDSIRPQFACWRNVYRMDDEAMAAQIRADCIDILVDLAGHTVGNRLKVFARKPAPVQMTYLGYFDTTGLTAMDYILGNRWLLPESQSHLYTERACWLTDAHLCFTPPDIPVEVGPLPAQQVGHVTFGCFNKTEKVNTRVIACWAKLLHAVPGSRLYLKSKSFGDSDVAEHYQNLFAGQGIGAERLILEGESGFREYLESHNRVDIALDPYPYNGGTTTAQALWMGVPVLVLQGDRYVAHMGESILHAVDMPEWIAADEDDYISKAVAFARDIPVLAAVRAGLRDRLLASPICNAPRFARNLEAAFRGMWQKWCEQQKPHKVEN